MSRLLLDVAGMTCTGCESRIANVLGRVDGVRDVAADHRAGTVTIDYDGDEPPGGVLRQRLTDAGFAVTTEEPR